MELRGVVKVSLPGVELCFENAWVNTGTGAIATWLTGGSANPPNKIVAVTSNPSTADIYDKTTEDVSGDAYVAQWKASFPASGEISGITGFRLQYETSIYATVGVSEFTKPDGVAMYVTWRTTIQP